MSVFAVPRSTAIAFAGKSDVVLKGQRMKFPVLVQKRVGAFERQAECLGDRRIDHLSINDVETFAKWNALLKRALPAEVGKSQRIRECCIRESERRSARHSARHVRNTVMNNPIDYISGVFVSCGLYRLDASALIDCDVDDD